ncbi:hypothetical protein DFQ26_005172, partial [Actinomortierella ambigua]
MACATNPLLPATVSAAAPTTDTSVSTLPTTTTTTTTTTSSSAPTLSDTVAAVTPSSTCASSPHTQSLARSTFDQYTPSIKLAEEINEINQLKTIRTGLQVVSSMPPMSSSVSQSSVSAGISTLLAQTAAGLKPTIPTTNSSQHPSDASAASPTTTCPAPSSEAAELTAATGEDFEADADVDADPDAYAGTFAEADADADADVDADADADVGRALRKELNWVNAVPSHFDASSPNPRKRRRRTNRAELQVLEDAFARNLLPDAATRQELGQRLGMSVRAVQIWFQNRRQSLRKKSSSMQNLHTNSSELSSTDSLANNATDLLAEARMRTPGFSLDCAYKNGSGDEGYAPESGLQSLSSSSSDSSTIMSPPTPSWQHSSSVEEDDGLDAVSLMMGRAKSCSDLLLSRRPTNTLFLRSSALSPVPSLTPSLSTLSSSSDSSFSSNSTVLPPLASPNADGERATPSFTRMETMDPIVEESVAESLVPADGAPKPSHVLHTIEMDATQSISQLPTEPVGGLVDVKLAQHHLSMLLQEAKKDPATSSSPASNSAAASDTTATTTASHNSHAPVLANWDASADSKPVLNAFGHQESVSVAAYAGSSSHSRPLSSKRLVKKGSSSLLSSTPPPLSFSDVSKPTIAATLPLSTSTSSPSLVSNADTLAKVTTNTNSNTVNNNNNNINSNINTSNNARRYHYTKSRPKSLMEMVIHRQREQQREQQLQRQMQHALETNSPSLSTSAWPQRLPRPKKKTLDGYHQTNNTSSSGHGSIASSNFRQSAVLATKQGRTASALAYPEYPAEFHPLHLKQKRQQATSPKPMLTTAAVLSQIGTYRDQERAKALDAEETKVVMGMQSSNPSTTAAAAASTLQQLLRGQSTNWSLNVADHASIGDSDDDLQGSSPLTSSTLTNNPIKSSPILQAVKVTAPTPPHSERPKAFSSMPSLDTVCSWSQLKRVQSDSVLLSHPFQMKKTIANMMANINKNYVATGQRAQRARRLEIGRDLFQSDSDATVDQTEEEEEEEEEEEDDDDNDDVDTVKVKREEEEEGQQRPHHFVAHRFPTAAMSKLTGKNGRSMTMQHLPTTRTASPTTTTTTTKATSLKRGRRTASSRPTLQRHLDHRTHRLEMGRGENVDEIEHQRASFGNHHYAHQPHSSGNRNYSGHPSSFPHRHGNKHDDASDDDDDDDDDTWHPRHRRRVSTSGHSRQSSISSSGGGGVTAATAGAAADDFAFRPPPMGFIHSTPSSSSSSAVMAATTSHNSLPPVGYFSPPRVTAMTTTTTGSAAWRPTLPPSPPVSLLRGSLEDEDDKHFMDPSYRRRPSAASTTD